MEKQLLEAEKHHKVAEPWMNEAIEDHSLAEELCTYAKEREWKAVTYLLSFQRQRRESEQIWDQEVARLRK